MVASASLAPSTAAADNETLRAQNAELMAKLREATALIAASSGVGKMPIPDTLKPTGLLEGVQNLPIPNHREGQKLYRCGIKPEIPFSLDIPVGPCNFRSRTFRWEGRGQDAEMRGRNGSVVALTKEEIDLVRARLPFMFYRQNFHSSGSVLGIEVIDISDTGSVYKDPVTKVETVHGAVRLNGRTQGNERPLAEILVFEHFGDDVSTETVKAAIEKAAIENDENEDVEAMRNAGIQGMEAGTGGKGRNRDLLKKLSTMTKTGGKAEAGFQG